MRTRSKCLNPDHPLEDLVASTFRALKVADAERAAVMGFLEPLRLKGDVTHAHYEHSLRVGLIAESIGRFMHLESKALFYAGLLHDIGKCQAPLETLGKTEGWTAEDAAAMEPHVMDAYRMIRGRFDFTAEIILWSHKFQAAGYPAVLPPFLHDYREGAKMMIRLYGYLLAMADVYDSLHRVNNKSGEVRELNEEEIKAKMLEFFPDQKRLAAELYEARIFVCQPTMSEKEDRS